MKAEIIAEPIKKPKRKFLEYIFGNWDRTQMVICFTLLGLVAIAPLFIRSPYYLGILILTVLYAYIGISWNIVAGFTGQLLIAHIIFLGIGAFTTIVLLNTFGISPWFGILLGGVTAGILGLLVSMLTLRYGLKMDYFALFTIALMVALRTLFLKWDLVGGAIGMWVRVSESSPAKMIFLTKEPYLYIALVLTVFALIIQYRISHSKLGKYFVAIREDENAAAALGVNTSLFKTIAVVIGATLGGIGGGFYVMYVTFISPPNIFDLGLNVELVIASPVIGGLGSLAGPILGAFLYKPLAELMRGLLSAERAGSSLIVYGSFLIFSILFMPKGITGVVHYFYRKLRTRLMVNQPGGTEDGTA
jgi:branched-chain amino acid transport system permease protein